MNEDDLLEEQRRFYSARAPEYDDWWQRSARYDRGDEDRREWDAQVAMLDVALSSFGAIGDVLELAGGTGWWTTGSSGLRAIVHRGQVRWSTGRASLTHLRVAQVLRYFYT